MMLPRNALRGIAVAAIAVLGLASKPPENNSAATHCVVCVSDCNDILLICFLACGNTTGGLCGHLDTCGGDLGIIICAH
jgi:hypothetical protein